MNLQIISPFAPLALRFIPGLIFMAHGLPKLMDLAYTSQLFNGLGIPLPGLMACFVAIVEVFGGIALIVGLGTRIVSLLLAIILLVALLLVHVNDGFVGGFEFQLALLACLVALMLGGPGRLALDNMFISFFPRDRQFQST